MLCGVRYNADVLRGAGRWVQQQHARFWLYFGRQNTGEVYFVVDGLADAALQTHHANRFKMFCPFLSSVSVATLVRGPYFRF